MTTALKQYEELEKAMLTADRLADHLREQMDALWYEHLTRDERISLSSRSCVTITIPKTEPLLNDGCDHDPA